MRSNSEFMAQAIAAIPLWRAFLDKKEAEQDALLAEVLADKPKPTLLSGLTARFSRRNTAELVDQSAIEQPIPIIEEAVTDEDEKMPPLESDDASGLREEEQKAVTASDEVPNTKVEMTGFVVQPLREKGDNESEREVVSTEDSEKKEVASSNKATQFQNIFN